MLFQCCLTQKLPLPGLQFLIKPTLYYTRGKNVTYYRHGTIFSQNIKFGKIFQISTSTHPCLKKQKKSQSGNLEGSGTLSVDNNVKLKNNYPVLNFKTRDRKTSCQRGSKLTLSYYIQKESELGRANSKRYSDASQKPTFQEQPGSPTGKEVKVHFAWQRSAVCGQRSLCS